MFIVQRARGSGLAQASEVNPGYPSLPKVQNIALCSIRVWPSSTQFDQIRPNSTSFFPLTVCLVSLS